MRISSVVLLSLISLSAAAEAIFPDGPIADLCVARPLAVVRLDESTIEFKTVDGVYRTSGNAAETRRMLHNLNAAMKDTRGWSNGIHVLRRTLDLTYVDDVTFDGACRLVLCSNPECSVREDSF